MPLLEWLEANGGKQKTRFNSWMLSWLRRREDTIEERNCSCHRNKGKSLETEPAMSQQNIAVSAQSGAL
ncbi:hypothetical protein KY284_001886 [Solanum tuberosum]|nr:hypothetical protein KY284_001886 [Solanum tuberosum]